MSSTNDALDAAVADSLALDWSLGHGRFAMTRHDLGMNSRTWLITAGDERWVAKAVPLARRSGYEGGLRTAAHVEAAGIPAGAPVLTRDGWISVVVEGHVLALLRYVPGEELEGTTEDERRLMGSVLGRAHRALHGIRLADAAAFHWVEPSAAHLSLRPWIRPAVADGVAGYDALGLDTLTPGPLHTDPAPEAFRLDAETGICGLIDWDNALVGPLLYDLASAVLYVGGPERGAPLVEAYLAERALDRAEVQHGLLPMLRFRWAVQADYFAHRIATNDLTGIVGPEDNEVGLEDARRALVERGAQT